MMESSRQPEREMEELLCDQAERKQERIAMLGSVSSGGAMVYETPEATLTSEQARTNIHTAQQPAPAAAPIRLPDPVVNVTPIADLVMAAASRNVGGGPAPTGDVQAEPTARFDREWLQRSHSSHHPSSSISGRRIIHLLLLAATAACLCGIVAGILERRPTPTRQLAQSLDSNNESQGPIPDTRHPTPDTRSVMAFGFSRATNHEPRVTASTATSQAAPIGPYIEPALPAVHPTAKGVNTVNAAALSLKQIAQSTSSPASPHTAIPKSKPASAGVKANKRSPHPHLRYHRHVRHRSRETDDIASIPDEVLAGHPAPGWDEKADRWIDNLR